MKYSKQREIILNTVRGNLIHPTADDVYVLTRQELPNVSLGTVYRNLNLLSQNGDIVKISMPNASDRFDGNTSLHYHMVCESCGKVQDVSFDFLQGLENYLRQETGFSVTRCELLLKGICKDCGKQD